MRPRPRLNCAILTNMSKWADVRIQEAALGHRLHTASANRKAEQLLREAVTAQAERLGLTVQRLSQPAPMRNAHARGRYACVVVDGRGWCAQTGYVSPHGYVRLYFRAQGQRTLEVTVRPSELEAMAQWAVQLLAGADGWDAPPVPVGPELEDYGRDCRYVWTQAASAVYGTTQGIGT